MVHKISRTQIHHWWAESKAFSKANLGDLHGRSCTEGHVAYLKNGKNFTMAKDEIQNSYLKQRTELQWLMVSNLRETDLAWTPWVNELFCRKETIGLMN